MTCTVQVLKRQLFKCYCGECLCTFVCLVPRVNTSWFSLQIVMLILTHASSFPPSSLATTEPV